MAEQDTAQNHYQMLRVKPTASAQEIRRAYRDLSKLYHPDTTQLPPEIATEKFKHLNEAYATLSNPEKRIAYDYSIGISRFAVIQPPAYLNRPAAERGRYEKNSAYLDPTDRPLSPGELFALFILGLTFVGCLVLVFAIGWTQGELVLHPATQAPTPVVDSPAPAATSDPFSKVAPPDSPAAGAPTSTPPADLPTPPNSPEPAPSAAPVPPSGLPAHRLSFKII